jgi:hypothetical protein
MADVSVTLTPGAQYPVTVNDTVGSSGIAAPLTSFDVSIDAVAGINAMVSGTTERIVTLVTGVPGATGASPTLSVFSTVATVPSGTNGSASLTGTTSNPVLRLTLPAGATGSQGPQGDQGVGINGAVIDANGHLLLSNTDGYTYDAGYAVGPTGPEGQQGIEGPQGHQGDPGSFYNQDLNSYDSPTFAGLFVTGGISASNIPASGVFSKGESIALSIALS